MEQGLQQRDLVDLVDGQGATFNSRYVLRGVLGRGCSACVFYCESRGGGAQTACKLARYQPRMLWTKIVSTFEREATLLCRCAHPSVAELFGIYQSEAAVALVIGLVAGGDLQQLLMRHGALSERATASIGTQLVAALGHLHGAFVLHRDVKLENVLVESAGPEPRVKLCDFGHSCLRDEPLDGVSVTDGFRGTDGYAAPEVAAVGYTWTAEADVWSLGVVLYALLANELLRWNNGHPEVSTKTSRAFAQISTRTKMLVKAILQVEPTLRPLPAELHSRLMELLEERAPLGIGLRKSKSNMGKAYSLTNIASLVPDQDSSKTPPQTRRERTFRLSEEASGVEGEEGGQGQGKAGSASEIETALAEEGEVGEIGGHQWVVEDKSAWKAAVARVAVARVAAARAVAARAGDAGVCYRTTPAGADGAAAEDAEDAEDASAAPAAEDAAAAAAAAAAAVAAAAAAAAAASAAANTPLPSPPPSHRRTSSGASSTSCASHVSTGAAPPQVHPSHTPAGVKRSLANEVEKTQTVSPPAP